MKSSKTQQIPSERFCSGIDLIHEKKVAIYIRVSTDAQAEEGYSIQAQTEKLIALCKSRGWDDYELYVDPGFSGSTLDRPKIQQLIQDINQGKIGTVVVYKLDRLSRRQKDTMHLIEDVFVPAGVNFVSLNESFDTATPYGRAMIGMLSSFAQLERENIFMRTRMGMLERVKLGYWPGGGRIPYGYSYDSTQGILVPKEGEAENVKKIYDLYIHGYAPQKIANMLGLKYDKLVTQILTRISNTGKISYKGEIYQGRHEPIVSTEVYEEAMQIMQDRRESNARSTPNSVHLLSGILYCGKCGARLRYMKWGKGGYKLVCYSHMNDKPYMKHDTNCSFEPIWADEVEQAIIKDIFGLSVRLERSNNSDCIADPVADLETQISKTEAKLKRLYHLFGENEADKDAILVNTIDETTKKLKQLKKDYAVELEQHTKRKRISLIVRNLVDVREIWPLMTENEKQLFLREIVRKVNIINENNISKAEVSYVFTLNNEENESNEKTAIIS